MNDHKYLFELIKANTYATMDLMLLLATMYPEMDADIRDIRAEWDEYIEELNAEGGSGTNEDIYEGRYYPRCVGGPYHGCCIGLEDQLKTLPFRVGHWHGWYEADNKPGCVRWRDAADQLP